MSTIYGLKYKFFTQAEFRNFQPITVCKAFIQIEPLVVFYPPSMYTSTSIVNPNVNHFKLILPLPLYLYIYCLSQCAPLQVNTYSPSISLHLLLIPMCTIQVDDYSPSISLPLLLIPMCTISNANIGIYCRFDRVIQCNGCILCMHIVYIYIQYR